ncbi:hypothetical protein JCM9140_146 [Halalkalibacter wakoensis JCM 9140]|uniref:Flagellar hook-length control protein-like C-terminal domain-containing protein n=1 Tax=Halalkalibacter wakoensis JCM 9140 TaxID=1236970 RepID=W4PYM9_9BACI|nr:hypothetical protein [Halalkalibacter wakoensis]GAE24234.1 hypothetical protein JCM9140_146 [Halalkalibacter wakoensis JCM 9140]
MFQPSIQTQQPGGVPAQQSKVVNLKEGQLFQGEITKLFPNQLATLKVGRMHLTAKLEAALTVGQRYWFEVKDGKGIPKLKVLTDNQTKLASNSNLVQNLGLPLKKESEMILSQLTAKQTLFTRNEVMNGLQILKQLNQSNPNAIQTMVTMIQQGIPLTQEWFLASHSSNQSQSFGELLSQLVAKLRVADNQVANQAVNVLNQLLKTDVTENFGFNAGQVSRNAGSFIQSIASLIGYDYEHDVAKFIRGEMGKEDLTSTKLKALLLQLQQQDISMEMKNLSKEVISRITAYQLTAHEQTGAYHQFLLHLPLALGPFQTDATIKWEGKREENGELDPDHCRIVFYLTLEKLEETMVDVQVQNRVVSISIYNENEKPEALLKHLIPTLQTHLSNLQYLLSTVSWKKISDAQVKTSGPIQQSSSTYKGVDIRI